MTSVVRKIPAVIVLIVHISFNTMYRGHAINPGCICISFVYGKDRGTFHSPNYPQPYPPNIDCLLYSFKAAPHEIVELVFTEFHITKRHTQCSKGDYLKVYAEVTQGSEMSTGQHRVGVNEYSEWSRILCGPRSEVPSALYSAGPAMVLEFHSESTTNNFTGFIGTFQFLDKPSKYALYNLNGDGVQQVHETRGVGMFETDGSREAGSECNYAFSSSSSRSFHGRIFSPRYPSNYPNNVRCVYKFHAKNNERVRVFFEELSFQKGDQSCLNRADIIKVFDGSSDMSPSIAMFCNELSGYEVLSTGSNLYIEFTANSDWPGKGFKAIYQFQSREEPNNDPDFNIRGITMFGPEVSATTSSCQESINSDTNKSGTIFSQNYPQAYPLKSRCHYDFTGRGKERIQLMFKDFDLFSPIEGIRECDNLDSLEILIYVDGRLDKLDSYCGNETPKQIMSNSPKMMIEFRGTISSINVRGFKIEYRFIENFGINTGRQLIEFPCAFVYNSLENNQGFFKSPNFPGPYPRDTECNYFFHGQDSERVNLHFSYFDVEGVLPCDSVSSSDYVEFSNFMVKDKKYSRYCGRINNFSIESDRKFFKVTFRSNSRLDGGGFYAHYNFFNGKTLKRIQHPEEMSNAKSKSISCLWLVVFIIFTQGC